MRRRAEDLFPKYSFFFAYARMADIPIMSISVKWWFSRVETFVKLIALYHCLLITQEFIHDVAV